LALAQAGALDGAAAAGARLPALRLGRLAGVGREPTGGPGWRGAGAGRPRADRLRGVVPPRRARGVAALAARGPSPGARLRGRGGRGRAARRRNALRLAGAPAAVAVGPLAGGTLFASAGATPPAAASGAKWEPFTLKRLADLRAQGTPVFVNFTAAWCITCLVNERVAAHSSAGGEALARQGV